MKQNTALTVIGWALTLFIGVGLLFSASFEILQPPEFLKEWVEKFHYSKELAIPIGITKIVCVLFFLVPQTRVLGAVLLTGYLGGATATHVRVSDPFYGPIIAGVIVWLALFFRDPKIRALLPIAWPEKAPPAQ